MSNDSLLARAAALAQRQGTAPPAGSDVAKYISKVSPGVSTTPSGGSVVDSNARPGYTADQSMSRALGLMGNVTRGFTGSLTSDPVSQLRALPGGDGGRVATPENTGLSRFDMFRDAISREASNSLGSIDSVMRAINIPIMDRVTLRSAGGAKNAPKDQNGIDFSKLLSGKPPAQFASDFPLSSSTPGNTTPLIDSRKSDVSAGSHVYNQPYDGYLTDAVFNMSQGPGGSYSHGGKTAWDIYPMKAVGGSHYSQEQRQDIPVVAVTGGDVVYSGPSAGYGNLVVVRDADGTLYKYGHNADNAVNVGDRIGEGQILGQFGKTGGPKVTGVHVHFEVVKDANWGSDWYEGGRSLSGREQSDVWERLAYWYGL